MVSIVRGMPPKDKVSERGDLGHGITFEVRPAAKGNPTIHVIVGGQRLSTFRKKPDSSAEAQVRDLSAVKAKLLPKPTQAGSSGDVPLASRPSLESGVDEAGGLLVPRGSRRQPHNFPYSRPGECFEAGQCRNCSGKASMRCSRCKVAYFCSEGCFEEAWLNGGQCDSGALQQPDGSHEPLTWPPHSVVCRPFKAWPCTSCRGSFNDDGKLTPTVQCAQPGCLEWFCNVDCSLCSACPHATDLDDDLQELREARAAAGACGCICCQTTAGLFTCTSDGNCFEADDGQDCGWRDCPAWRKTPTCAVWAQRLQQVLTAEMQA